MEANELVPKENVVTFIMQCFNYSTSKLLFTYSTYGKRSLLQKFNSQPSVWYLTCSEHSVNVKQLKLLPAASLSPGNFMQQTYNAISSQVKMSTFHIYMVYFFKLTCSLLIELFATQALSQTQKNAGDGNQTWAFWSLVRRSNHWAIRTQMAKTRLKLQ